MKEVKIKTTTLLAAVRKNRDAHIAELKTAKEGHKIAVLKALQERIDSINTGGEVHVNFSNYTPFGNSDSLHPPQDHTKDYDRVVSMLEMSVDPETVLDATEFNQFVMDEWTWSQMSKLVNSSYSRLVHK